MRGAVWGVSLHAPAIYGRLTVRENLEFHAEVFGVSRGEARARASWAIELFDLDECASTVGLELSVGTRRRADLARATLHDPEIIVLDEPTAGVDVMSVRAIRDVLRSLAAQGKTVVVTTHEVNEAERLFDQVAILNRGRVIREGTVQEILDDAHASGEKDCSRLEDAFVALIRREQPR